MLHNILGDIMKDILKGSGMIILGLLVAIIIYPLFHELGHMAVILFAGEKIVEWQLLPTPYVQCHFISASKIQIVMVGMGGMLLPVMLTSFRPPKRFWIWYTWVLMKGICVLSFVLSIMAIIMYQIKSPMMNEDMTQILYRVPECAGICCVVFLVLIYKEVSQIIRSKPLQRCMEQFDMEEKNSE